MQAYHVQGAHFRCS